MVRKLFRRDQTSIVTGQKAGSLSDNSFVDRFSKPAVVLAFLLAISGAAWASNQANGKQIPAEQPNEQITGLEVETSTNSGLQGTIENLVEQNTNVSTHSTIENGEANVEVKVNGQEVPVLPEGTTHEVITDETGQTTVDINIQDNSSSSTTTVNGSSDVDSRINIESESDFRIRTR